MSVSTYMIEEVLRTKVLHDFLDPPDVGPGDVDPIAVLAVQISAELEQQQQLQSAWNDLVGAANRMLSKWESADPDPVPENYPDELPSFNELVNALGEVRF